MAVYDTLVHRAHTFHLFSALSPLPPPESLSTLYMALLSHPTTNTDTQPGTVHRRVRTSMGESSRVVSFEPLLPHSAVSNSTAATAGNTGCSSRTGPTAARRNGTKGRAMINNGGLYALCSQKYQPVEPRNSANFPSSQLRDLRRLPTFPFEIFVRRGW